MLKTILFDLDGTLLPMDQDRFVKEYFQAISAHFVPLGFDPQKTVAGIFKGTEAMIKNDGSAVNAAVFWNHFDLALGVDTRPYRPEFDRFYEDKFDALKSYCTPTPLAKRLVDLLHQKGYRTVLATNPVFPPIATQKRATWAGLSTDAFERYTHYENSTFCKPNPAYFSEILKKIDCAPDECLMIGNDASEDLSAAKIGIPVFLITDCLINKKEKDLSAIPHGSFASLLQTVEEKGPEVLFSL